MSDNEKKTDTLDYVLEKSAFLGAARRAAGRLGSAIKGTAKKFEQGMAEPISSGGPSRAKNMGDIAKTVTFTGSAATLPYIAINHLKKQIQNDTRRKALIEDLYMNDPVISQADREEVIEYYATILSVAPSISLDKNVVRELLQNFIKFGRVDLQTIKTLADTEKTMKDADKKSFKVPGLGKGGE